MGSPEETFSEDIQASQDLSDISTVEFDVLGESDSEDMLHKLGEAYHKSFPDQPSATPAFNSSSDIPNTSTSFLPDDLSSSEASNSSTGILSEPWPETSGCSTSNGTDASQPQVLVQGINVSLVRTTRTYPDGKNQGAASSYCRLH